MRCQIIIITVEDYVIFIFIGCVQVGFDQFYDRFKCADWVLLPFLVLSFLIATFVFFQSNLASPVKLCTWHYVKHQGCHSWVCFGCLHDCLDAVMLLHLVYNLHLIVFVAVFLVVFNSPVVFDVLAVLVVESHVFAVFAVLMCVVFAIVVCCVRCGQLMVVVDVVVFIRVVLVVHYLQAVAVHAVVPVPEVEWQDLIGWVGLVWVMAMGYQYLPVLLAMDLQYLANVVPLGLAVLQLAILLLAVHLSATLFSVLPPHSAVHDPVLVRLSALGPMLLLTTPH